MVHRVAIDLRDRPEARWGALAAHRDAARALIAFYLRDLEGTATRELVAFVRDAVVPAEYVAEMRGIASYLGLDELDVVIANLYYDALKAAIGCTAFAIDTPDGPLHARNLDWWGDGDFLTRETLVMDLRGGDAGRYQLVGWPGFVGCFSGVATGRFAVTLNAVTSTDSPAIAPAVVFVLRRVLETALDFAAAVDAIASAPIASDCLLLVTGVSHGEMVVIERTPTRSAVRGPVDGQIAVTNDYRVLAATTGAPRNLAETSCGRFDRATSMIREHPPRDAAACRVVLDDPGVKMCITAQQMVLSARRGTIEL
jgi:acyl-CoA:6-aminopenicillanic acid acyl transferase